VVYTSSSCIVVDFPLIKPAAIHQCVAQDADSNIGIPINIVVTNKKR
jgi:hypothetical protein